MSIQPNTTMTAIALRAYVLAHRDEEEALHAYINKLHAENRDSQVYKPDDNVADVIASAFKKQKIGKVN